MESIVLEVSLDGIMSSDTSVIYEAFDYNNWYSRENKYRLYFSSIATHKIYGSIRDLLNKSNEVDIDSYIPVGSIEFVEKHLNKHIKAINIPERLRDYRYTHRKVWVGDIDLLRGLLSNHRKLFIKDADRCKKYTPMIVNKFNVVDNLPKSIFISEYLDIKAEYRAFVYKNEIIDCRQYLGEYKCKFDEKLLDEMVAAWKEDSPKSYTLDIGVTDDGHTVIIEVHNFISCGLYGFEHSVVLPNMIIDAYKQEKDGVIR